MKKIALISGIIIFMAVAGSVLFRDKENEPEYRTDKIVKGDIEMTVTATGTVNPVTTVLVGTQVSGTIKELYADFNSPVKKG